MKVAQLEPKDRRNLGREDARNVFTLVTTKASIDYLLTVMDSLEDAVNHMTSAGERRAYVVIKITK